MKSYKYGNQPRVLKYVFAHCIISNVA